MLGIRTRLLHWWLESPARRQHARTLQALRDSGQSPQRVLFLCYGNICRSPAAEQFARRLMPGKTISSAGFYPEAHRPSPSNVQRAAQTLGIDLSSWSSRRADPAMVKGADLIVLHDLKNFLSFKNEFPDELGKVVFLGLFLDPPQISITDPYGKPDGETLAILRQIESAVQNMARAW
jgi:protein-tyrosine phosphatase